MLPLAVKLTRAHKGSARKIRITFLISLLWNTHHAAPHQRALVRVITPNSRLGEKRYGPNLSICAAMLDRSLQLGTESRQRRRRPALDLKVASGQTCPYSCGA